MSALLGLVGGVLSSEVWWQSVSVVNFQNLWLVVRVGLVIPRALHELIWRLFFINIFGLDPLVAVLVIAMSGLGGILLSFPAANNFSFWDV